MDSATMQGAVQNQVHGSPNAQHYANGMRNDVDFFFPGL